MAGICFTKSSIVFVTTTMLVLPLGTDRGNPKAFDLVMIS
jgi:hypothetical protein